MGGWLGCWGAPKLTPNHLFPPPVAVFFLGTPSLLQNAAQKGPLGTTKVFTCGQWR